MQGICECNTTQKRRRGRCEEGGKSAAYGFPACVLVDLSHSECCSSGVSAGNKVSLENPYYGIWPVASEEQTLKRTTFHCTIKTFHCLFFTFSSCVSSWLWYRFSSVFVELTRASCWSNMCHIVEAS